MCRWEFVFYGSDREEVCWRVGGCIECNENIGYSDDKCEGEGITVTWTRWEITVLYCECIVTFEGCGRLHCVSGVCSAARGACAHKC